VGIFLFTTASRTALGPTQPPIQWVPGALSLGVKRPGREDNHSPPSSAEVKECMELYLHSPNTPSWRGAQLKHRDNFTFTFYYYSVITIATLMLSSEHSGFPPTHPLALLSRGCGRFYPNIRPDDLRKNTRIISRSSRSPAEIRIMYLLRINYVTAVVTSPVSIILSVTIPRIMNDSCRLHTYGNFLPVSPSWYIKW
jgi:hypothetical protein